MNIDLLFSRDGHSGLIASENFVKKLAGILVDIQTGLMTIEYTDMEPFDLNIPIDSNFFASLERCKQINIGAVIGGHIAQAYQVPLMFQDDPYRLQEIGRATQHPQPLKAFEYFIKSAISGQPVHRDNLDNDETQGCVLGDSAPSSLQFAPHLERRAQLEAQPAAPTPGNLPSLGLGSSGSATTTNRNTAGGNTGGNKET